MKPSPEDGMVERSLRRLRLAEPRPGFRDRVLHAARREWRKRAVEQKERSWLRPLLRPAFALAAGLAIAALGGWVNDMLVRAPTAELQITAAAPEESLADGLGRALRFPSGRGFASGESAWAALDERRTQLNDLLGPRPEAVAPVWPNRGTQGLRQETTSRASCC